MPSFDTWDCYEFLDAFDNRWCRSRPSWNPIPDSRWGRSLHHRRGLTRESIATVSPGRWLDRGDFNEEE
jgi:hypothetical protein